MATRTAKAEEDVGQSLAESIDDYRLSLHAGGKSASTQSVYTLALTYFDAFLAEMGMPRTLSAIRREHIEAWLAAVRDSGRAAATVSVYYRSLQPFWRWAVEEGFLPGGGVALLRGIYALDKLKVENEDQRAGINIRGPIEASGIRLLR